MKIFKCLILGAAIINGSVACSATSTPFKIRTVNTVDTISSYNLGTNDFKDGLTYTVTGLIRLVGTGPFHKLILSTGKGANLIISASEEDLKKLYDYQYRFVQIKGKVSIKKLILADQKTVRNELHIVPESIIIIREKEQRF